MTEIKLSRRVQSVPPSAIRRFFDLASEMKDEVLSLSIGEPDFVTPWAVTDAGMDSLERGHTHYSPNTGYLSLRREISRYLEDRYGVHYDPRSQVLCTVGGSEGIDLVLRGLIDPGDEVIIPEPCFVAYKACTLLSGGVPVTLSTRPEDGFRVLPEDLERLITPKTRLLIVGYPNNPTGAVMSKQDWDKIAEVLRRHPQVAILTDELYTELDYTGAEPSSLIQYPDLYERCFYIGGFSKAFAMTGWRIGYLCGPGEVLREVNKIHQYGIMSAPTVAQYAAEEALKNHRHVAAEMREAYNQRRLLIAASLEKDGIPLSLPGGAFYAFPNISAAGLSSNAFCERFLQEEKVAIIPGAAFGECGEGFVRISYAAAEEVIEEALVRLGRFYKKLLQEKKA